MNLSDQEKRLFSSAGIALAAIILAGLLYWGGASAVNYFEDKAVREKLEIIRGYEVKIDSLNKKNNILTKEIDVLDFQVDSLQSVKNKIIWNYGKKIRIITDDSAAEHAMWMDSILQDLDNLERY